MADFSRYQIPSHTQGALERYLDHGLPPGGFLSAVIANDLMGAVARADIQNMTAIPEIAKFLFNEAPAGSWGSDENLENWLAKFREFD